MRMKRLMQIMNQIQAKIHTAKIMMKVVSQVKNFLRIAKVMSNLPKDRIRRESPAMEKSVQMTRIM